MGLLDDAIREHLDLKRRRGADPAEVERAEREALGPVRRNRDTATAVDPDGLDSADPAWDEPDESVSADLVQERFPSDDDHPTQIASLADDEPYDAAEFAPPPLRFDDDEPLRPGAADLDSEPASTLSEETSEYTFEDALPDEDDEDVLEETPEFLQDTPDHDRLWFEQRPPRDFDFDG